MLFEKRIVSVSERRHVLYRFPVPWRARRLAALLREAEEIGISMQRCERVSARWSDLVRHGGCWLVASYEAGESMQPSALNGDIVASLATSLARLHSIRSGRHGPIFQFGRPFRSLATVVGGEIGHALRSAALHDSAEKAGMGRWLREHGAFLQSRDTFHLVHGDLLSKNILVKEGGAGICLIDYELASFDHAGFELAAALIRFFGGRNLKFLPEFFDRYFAVCDQDVAKDWNAHSHYFLVASLLRLARTRVRRRRILSQRGEDEAAAVQTGRIDNYAARAFALMRAYDSGAKTPDEMLKAHVAPKPAPSARTAA